VPPSLSLLALTFVVLNASSSDGVSQDRLLVHKLTIELVLVYVVIATRLC
jgi:hypothetical protein